MTAKQNERLGLCLIRYSHCLDGNVQDADLLAKDLICKKGLWSKFCKGVITNHGRIIRRDISANILGFLRAKTQVALELSGRGQNQLRGIYNTIEACQYFLVIFCAPRLNLALVGELGKVPSGDLVLAQTATYKILGLNGSELSELVLKFGKLYVERCRLGHIEDVHELSSLGGEWKLDIEDVGSSTEEVQQWLHAADLERVNKAYESLMEKSLDELLVDKLAPAHLQVVTNCLEPDDAMLAVEDLPWYMRTKPITAADLNLQPDDFEYIHRVQRAFEARTSV